MSDGIPFGGTAPAFPGGLDADQLAAVLRAIQASQPSAPTNDAPSAGVLSGIPSMLGGQMPSPQMATPQDDTPAPGRLPTLLGSRLPEMTSVEPQPAPAGAPAPQATGSIPQAAPAPAGGEPGQPAPSTPPAAPAPTAPAAARPPAPNAGMQPVSSFDPLTGQPVSGTPKPVAASAPAAVPAPTGAGSPGILGALSNPRVYNTLLGIGAGILSGKTFGEGLGQGIENAQRMNAQQGASDLAQARAQMEQSKLQRELAGQNQTAKIIASKMGIPIEDATALAMNPQYVQSFLSSQFGAQDGRVRNADGTMSVIPGSDKDPTQIAAATGAAREPIAEAAQRAGAIKGAEQQAGADDIETKEVPGFGLVSINKTKLASDKADERSNALSVLVPGQKPRPMSPEESRSFQGGYFDANGVPHTQAGGVTVNMPPAEKAEQAEIGKARGNVVADQITAGKSAVDRIRTLDQMSGALSAAGPNITTGPLGEPVLRAKQALGGLLGRELPGTSATEMFNNMGPILAGEAARAITNRPAQIEFTTMLNSKPGLMNSVEGNRAMMDVMRQRAVQDSELANIAARSSSTDEYLKRKDEYEAEHPMINPFTGQPFGSASAPGAKGGSEASSDRIVQVRTPAERDSLPTGARYIAPDGKLRIKQ